MEIKKLFSKYKNEQVSLYDHSIQVANMSCKLFDMLDIKDEDLRYLCYLTGLLHDIGKCSKNFQIYLKDETKKESYVYHNVLGYFMVKYLLNIKIRSDLDRLNVNELVSRCILFHHPISKEISKNISNIDIKDKLYSDIIDEYIEIANVNYLHKDGVSKKVIIDDINLESDLREGKIKYYISEYKDTKYNQYFNIITNIVKFADIMVSNHIDNVEKIINRRGVKKITDNDLQKPEHYDERFDKQLDYVKNRLSNKNINIFESETGFGKTMLGLLYGLLTTDKKIYWVCPRNSIAEGVYDRIIDELKNLKLDTQLSVGLLLTNKWQKGDKDSDIIVTNIDNFLRPIVKNDALCRCYDMLFSTVIFDEFHEYVCEESIMAFFDILLRTRVKTSSKTLLLSATPIMKLIPSEIDNKKFEHVPHPDKIISERKYKIKFIDDISNVPSLDKGYMISVNATKTAQNMVRNGMADRTLHSRFFDSDIDAYLGDILKEYGKGNRTNKKVTNWSATNIISTGVDISFDNIVINAPTPNRFVQTIGRCNRWSDDKEHTIIIMPLKSDENNKSEVFSLNKQRLKEFSIKLYNKLKETIGEREEVEFGELYNINKDFIHDNKEYNNYIVSMRDNSYMNLEQNISYNYAETIEGDEVILGNNSIRKTKNSPIKFFCKLKDSNSDWIDELFEGDTLIFNFDGFFKNKKDEKRKFENSLIKEIKNDKNYFARSSTAVNDSNIIGTLMNKAKSNKTPFPIKTYWHYDKILGVVREEI